MRIQPYRDQLHAALVRLAASSSDQLTYLQTLLSYPSVDELALDLYELVLLADLRVREGVISESVRDAVQAVDQKLDVMSGPDNAHLWTPEALLTAPEWQQVRNLAAIALRVLEPTN